MMDAMKKKLETGVDVLLFTADDISILVEVTRVLEENHFQSIIPLLLGYLKENTSLEVVELPEGEVHYAPIPTDEEILADLELYEYLIAA